MNIINVRLLLFIVTSIKLISCTKVSDSRNLKLQEKFKHFNLTPKNEVIKHKKLLQSCLTDYVEFHLKKQPKIITVILNDHIDISGIYMEELHKSWSTYVFDENYHDEHNHLLKIRMDILILLKNRNNLDILKMKIYDMGIAGSTYTIFLVDQFKNEKSFIEESNILTKLLWIKKLANIVIIGLVKNYYLAMTSNGFKPNILREPMDPVVVGQCQTGKWIINVKLFESMKMNNCTINVGYLNRKPYMYAVEKNNKREYKGIDFSILQVVANKLNFTINLSEIAETKSDTETQRIVNSLDSNKSYDLVIGGITWQPASHIQYTIPYQVVQLVWLVPVQPTKILFLTFPVGIKQWIPIIAFLLFLIIVKFILFREISFFKMISVLYGGVYNRRPARFSGTLFLMFWFAFGFMVSQFCLISVSDIIKIDYGDKIRTIEDLTKSGIELGGLKNTKNLFIGNKTFKNFREFEHIEYERNLQKLINGEIRKMALLAVMNFSTVNTEFDPSYVYVLPEAFMSFSRSFAVSPGLSYANEIDLILQRLKISGIITHFENIEAKRYNKKSYDMKSNVNSKLFSLFGYSQISKILGIGLALSSIAFIFELIIFRIYKIYAVRNFCKTAVRFWKKKFGKIQNWFWRR